MTGFLEDGILRMEGLSEQQLQQLNAALPAINTALTAIKPHMTNLIGIVQTIVRKQQELK